MDAPCKDCERIGCGAYHDICPEYQAYKKAKDEEREKNFRINNLKNDLRFCSYMRYLRSKKANKKRNP